MFHSHLKVMGIDTWTLRQQESSILPACYAYQLFHQDELVGLLFATAIVADNAIETLLQKMMTALKCEWQGQWFSVQPDCSDLVNLRFVVALGDGLDLQNFAMPIIQSYSPQKLMAEPKLKSETWQSLQAVFSLL